MCVWVRERERERGGEIEKGGREGDRWGGEKEREREGGRWRDIQTERQTIRNKRDKYIHRERVFV